MEMCDFVVPFFFGFFFFLLFSSFFFFFACFCLFLLVFACFCLFLLFFFFFFFFFFFDPIVFFADFLPEPLSAFWSTDLLSNYMTKLKQQFGMQADRMNPDPPKNGVPPQQHGQAREGRRTSRREAAEDDDENDGEFGEREERPPRLEGWGQW